MISPLYPNRDRHGRGVRGPVLPPGVPGRRTRRERFDEIVLHAVSNVCARQPIVQSIEFGVEDVPPSSPAPWENYSYVMARCFPEDHKRGLRNRVVFYRMPIQQRCVDAPEIETTVMELLVERVSWLLSIPPDDLTP